MRLSPETIDGLEFEARLARNPKIKAANDAFLKRVRTFREHTKHKTKSEMIAELKAHNPAYLVDLLNAGSEASVRDRYVMTFNATQKR